MANRRSGLQRLLATCGVGLVAGLCGCVVPQPLGRGLEQRVAEPRLQAEYFLYLPEAYVKNNGAYPGDPNRRWPVVMTFHGMKPYDTWDRQIHEWQEEADTYGYIVCAPWLQSCDGIFMQFPLRKEHDYVLKDKERVMACLDHLLATTRADPNAVLSTSWSSGGFMAHYFPNKFPHRFRCIATRLSNFSPDIMTDATVPLYRETPVAVFIGESDFPACTEQSKNAVAWYKSRGFRTVDGKMIDGIGHKRIPQTAAAFFARQLGIEPLDPGAATRTLSQLRMSDWTPDADLLSLMAPRSGPVATFADARPTPSVGATSLFDAMGGAPPSGNPTHAGTAGADYRANRPLPVYSPSGSQSPPLVAEPNRKVDVTARPVGLARVPAAGEPSNIRKPQGGPTGPYYRPYTAGPSDYPVDRLARSVVLSGPGAATGANEPPQTNPPKNAPPPTVARRAKPVAVRLSGPRNGYGPLYLAFSTDLADDQLKGADFLWSLNGTPICDTARGMKIFDTPGVHTLSVLLITRDGQEYRGSTTVQVQRRGDAGASR